MPSPSFTQSHRTSKQQHQKKKTVSQSKKISVLQIKRNLKSATDIEQRTAAQGHTTQPATRNPHFQSSLTSQASQVKSSQSKMSSPTSICVADAFHFSHYYWRSPDPAATSGSENEDSDSECQTQSQTQTQPELIYKPKILQPEDIKLKFHAQVLEDGSQNIHFGKWDGIPMDAADAYSKAAVQMTDYMYDLAMRLLPHHANTNDSIKYVDLGSGTAASAMRILETHPESQAVCLNLCHEQNVMALQATRQRGLSTDRIQIVEGTFEDASMIQDHTFDLAFSQDAFVHARSKRQAYREAFRVTKPGGAFVFCDVMAGDASMTSVEYAAFKERNALNDFLTPDENVEACQAVGWRECHWIDLTTDMRISFQLMLRKVNFVLEHGTISNIHRIPLSNYAQKIKDRIIQIDRGIFKWVVLHARKPVAIDIMCQTPVPFVNTSSLLEEKKEGASVVVIDILTKMPREKILALPKTVEVMITLSAGLDHIDMQACAEQGVQVRQSGRRAITSHVVQYALGFLILGLRQALSQLGVPFPKAGWNLTWNCPGKPLTDCKIAIVGLGMIAKEFIDEIRRIAPETTILYHVPEVFRDMDAEGKFKLTYCQDLVQMASECDVMMPLCPLNKHTEHIISAEVLQALRPDAGLINMARGKVVDTDALTKALQDKKIAYAILDTTYPEPLPENHPLWEQSNCFILPHFATNTLAVRKALVAEIQPIVEEHFGLGRSDEKLRQQEQALRRDLAVAHQLTAKHNMDMLVWNHISARFQTGCLITPGRKLWNQIRPEDLVYSSSNVTADIIHSAIYDARQDIKAIIHLHTPAATAVSCLESGFVPMTQDAAYFYNKVANYEWDGVSDDAAEGPAITAAVRAMHQCNTLLMHNHGFVCFGSSVKEAWVLAYYFERCCEVQLRVMQCGGKVKMPPTRVMALAAEASFLPEFAPGACEWEALCNEISFEE